MFEGQFTGNPFGKESAGQFLLVFCRNGQTLGGCGQAASALKEQKVFNRTESHFRPFILLHADQAAVQYFFSGKVRNFRLGLADDMNKGHMKKIGFFGGWILEDRAVFVLIRQAITHQGPEAFEDRLAGMDPNDVLKVYGPRNRKPFPCLFGV